MDWNLDALTAGFKDLLTEIIEDLKGDYTDDIQPFVERIATRAAFFGQKKLLGDPSADAELALVEGQILAVFAIVNRKAIEQARARIMQAVNIVLKFLLGFATGLS